MWFRGADVYDVGAQRFTRRDIEVETGRIASITDPGDIADGDTDLSGWFLLPGLIDCHVHITVDTGAADPGLLWQDARPGDIVLKAAENARRLLLCGITTARDVGGWDYHELAVRDAIDRGTLAGPRLLCAGKILSMTSSSTSYYRGMYEVVDGPMDVRRGARRQLAEGADHLKLLATGAMLSSERERATAVQLRPDEITEAVQIAHDNHTHVAVHAHADEGVRNAVLAGARSIEHGTYASDESLALMSERGTFLVPTVCTTQAMLADHEVLSNVPAHIRARLEQAHERQIDVLRRAVSAGVRIAMGTDAGTPGNHFGDNMQELEVMATEGGMSPGHVLRSATIEAASLLGLHAEIGSIDVGKRADMIGVRSDPLSDISALRSVGFVMRDGVVHRFD